MVDDGAVCLCVSGRRQVGIGPVRVPDLYLLYREGIADDVSHVVT